MADFPEFSAFSMACNVVRDINGAAVTRTFRLAAARRYHASPSFNALQHGQREQTVPECDPVQILACRRGNMAAALTEAWAEV